jgi:purine-binding chemotaxis protein CheW
MTGASDDPGVTAGRRLCTFSVGSLLLGVEVDRVQEITGEQPVTPVPLADAEVAGLLNLRGQILTVIDARARLAVPARGAGDPCAHAIMRVDGEAVSFLVDRAGDVVEIDDRAVEAVPTTIGPTIAEVLTGVCPLQAELLLLLDVDLTLAGAGN